MREFFEGEPGNLHDNVINRRLEAGRRGLGDVVGDFVERVPDGQLGGDLGNRKSGGLRCQRARAADARVHLDDAQAAVVGIDSELDVRAAGFHPDLADTGETGVPHHLPFLVSQRLDRGNGDRVAGVDAHRIEILNRTDDDAIVVLVPHHLGLEFLPANQRFFDEDLADGRRFESALRQQVELFAVVGDAASRSAERVRGANNDR